MALRQSLRSLARLAGASQALGGTSAGLAPLAAAAPAALLALRPYSAQAVAAREEKLPETTGWGSTRVGSVLKAKASGSSVATANARVLQSNPGRTPCRGPPPLAGSARGPQIGPGPQARKRAQAPGGGGAAAACRRSCPAARAALGARSPGLPRPTCCCLQDDDSGAWLWCSADDWVIDAIRKVAWPSRGRALRVQAGLPGESGRRRSLHADRASSRSLLPPR